MSKTRNEIKAEQDAQREREFQAELRAMNEADLDRQIAAKETELVTATIAKMTDAELTAALSEKP